MLYKSIIKLILIISISAAAAFAQPSTFVYQGKLQDSGVAANGVYQFQFKLYDAETGGNQVGLTLSGVTSSATNGIFAVNLSFGAGAFNSQEFRFLEIGVRANGSQSPYTVLNPRQQVTSTPYAIRALSAASADHANTADDSANLGGIPAAQYVITTDPRMSDDRDPLPNSPNYIQNGTSQQTASNFNISGEGKAFKLTGVLLNATSEFQQGGTRVMQFNNLKSGVVGIFAGPNSTGSDNMFVGYESGNSNSTGSYNTFVGSQSGKGNVGGINNSFFGAYSGYTNTTGTNNAFFGVNTGMVSNGSFNAFFGSNAGFANTTGSNNSLFGNLAGSNITFAGNNSMFGARAGENTTTGGNAFFGAFAGQKNNTGSTNVFVGVNAGKENLSGSDNIYVGFNAGGNNQTGNNNIAIGSGSIIGPGLSNSIALGKNVIVSQSNSLVVGGVSNGVFNLDMQVNGDVVATGTGNFSNGVGGSKVSVGLGGLTVSGTSTFSGNVTFTGGVNAATVAASGNGLFEGSLRGDTLGMKQLWNGGSTQICFVDSAGYKHIANCSSSRRYKDQIEYYAGGLDVLRHLKPVTFRWKSNGQADIGFVAEEVNEAEPLLNNFNEKGEIEGVKYAQITTVLVNAIKEQQKQIEEQKAQIDALKVLVCAQNPTSGVCGTNKEADHE